MSVDIVARGLGAQARRFALGAFQPNIIGSLGDSRAPIHADTSTQNQKAGNQVLNQMCALGLQRYITVKGGDWGFSGKRTDEYIALGLAGILASQVGIVRMPGGMLNDIGQDYPTAGTSGKTASDNIIAASKIILATGRKVQLEADPGQTGLTQLRITQLGIGNDALRYFAERTPNVIWNDDSDVYQMPNAGKSAITINPALAYDHLLLSPVNDTHHNQLGAYRRAKKLKLLYDGLVSPRPVLLTNINQVPANGRFQLIPNPVAYLTTSDGLAAGTTSTGVTGTIPAGSKSNITNVSGTCALALSIAADASGLGNYVNMAYTFGGVNDNCRYSQDIAIGDWSPGDWVEVFTLVEIVGTPTGLGAMFLAAVTNGDLGLGAGATSTTFSDGAGATAGGTGNGNMTPGPDEANIWLWKTDVFQIPAYVTKGFMSLTFNLIASGAGSGNARVRQMFAMRRPGP